MENIVEAIAQDETIISNIDIITLYRILENDETNIFKIIIINYVWFYFKSTIC